MRGRLRGRACVTAAGLTFAAVLALLPLGDAAAQIGYGQCQDRARDRLERDQRNTAVGTDRARSAYQADMQECVRLDARERARDTREDDQHRADQQRQDQQRQDLQRQEQQRQRQRDEQRRR
jgi:hypothetical protein